MAAWLRLLTRASFVLPLQRQAILAAFAVRVSASRSL